VLLNNYGGAFRKIGASGSNPHESIDEKCVASMERKAKKLSFSEPRQVALLLDPARDAEF